MSFKALAADDLARLTALDEHDEVVSFRPAGAGAGTACRAIIARGGEANLAGGMNVELYTALCTRAALVAITGGREAEPGDRLTCSDAGTTTPGEMDAIAYTEAEAAAHLPLGPADATKRLADPVQLADGTFVVECFDGDGVEWDPAWPPPIQPPSEGMP